EQDPQGDLDPQGTADANPSPQQVGIVDEQHKVKTLQRLEAMERRDAALVGQSKGHAEDNNGKEAK
ncbi:hypothetical protein Ancab_015609, partial [Ancistrocladus abbreviatus]